MEQGRWIDLPRADHSSIRSSLEHDEAAPMITLYVVRHAHADWQPDENRPLSVRGHADAVRVAELLAQRPVAAIYTSPARRAQQTVAPLVDRLQLPMQIVADLRERRLSATPVADFAAAMCTVWADPELALEGGESNRAAQQRAVTQVQALIARHQRQQIVLATHGNLLTLLLQHFDARLDFGFWQALTMPDVYEVQLAAATVSIQRIWS